MQPVSLARVAGAAFALVWALVAPTASAGGDVVVEMHRRGEALEVQARAVLAAPMPLAWKVLTDYERMPRFIPGIEKSVIRQRQGNHLLVEHTGAAHFLFFSFPIDVTLEVDESPMQWVTSRAVGGNFRRMLGRYDLSEQAGGRALLRYSGFIEPDFALPPLIGPAALRHSVREEFTAMVGEIERRAAEGR